ncbi:MAG: hypothetical protein RR248_00090 [Clostridia bacterium]
MTIFQNKKILLAGCLAILVVVVLCFVLTTLLVQKFTFENKIKELVKQIKDNEFLIDKYRNDIEYRKTTDYIIEQAKKLGLLTQEEIAWVNDKLN